MFFVVVFSSEGYEKESNAYFHPNIFLRFPFLTSLYLSLSSKHHLTPHTVSSLFPHSFDSLFHELLLSQLVSVWIYSTILAKNISASLLSVQALILGTGKDKMRLRVRVEKGKMDQQ